MILANHGIISSSGGFIPSTLNNNLIALYKAESNANDSLGNYNGSALGGLTYTTGINGNAFSFNGTTSYVNMGDVMDIGTSSWTYSFWVNSNTLTSGAYMTLFSKSLAGVSEGRIWCVMYGNKMQFNFTAPTGGASAISIETNTTFSTNTWYNIALTFDRADKMNIYSNGSLLPVTSLGITNNLIPYSSTNYDSANPFRIGAHTASDNITPVTFFDGKIDEFGVWNRVLTQSEITELQTKYYPF